MRYEVPNLRLIPQDHSLSCWFASAQMLIQWRRNTRQMTEANLPDPTQVPAYVQLYHNNNVLPWVMIRQFAKELGLVTLPLMSPTPEAILHWLRTYGPIWMGGAKLRYGHVVVIGGISFNPDQILILDPEPMNVGTRRWHPMSRLASILRVGTDPGIDQLMLRLP